MAKPAPAAYRSASRDSLGRPLLRSDSPCRSARFAATGCRLRTTAYRQRAVRPRPRGVESGTPDGNLDDPVKIWIDADASPNAVKEICFRTAPRLQLEVVLVANHFVRAPRSPYVRVVQVSHGFDVADDYLAAEAAPGDVAITADVPLAAKLVEKDVAVLTPRGERYSAENIGERLNLRDFMEEMRSGGLLEGGGPPPFGAKDKQAFANALDRLLTERLRG